jgi:hypothetical protein
MIIVLKTMTIRVICGEEWTQYIAYESGVMVFECWIRGNITFDELWEWSEKWKY